MGPWRFASLILGHFYIRQRFLEASQLRSEHAASIDDALREAMAGRLVEEYGEAKGTADAMWALARENQWYREGVRFWNSPVVRSTAGIVRAQSSQSTAAT